MLGDGILQTRNIDLMIQNAKILIVGALPPPVHGMAMINKKMSTILSKKTQIHEINISPMSKIESLQFIYKFINFIQKILWSLIYFRRWDVLYVGLSGGLGQVYESFFIFLARLLNKRIFIHHHSFAYINKSKIHFRILCMLGGKKCVHITLSEIMSKKLKSKYSKVKITRVISNSAFIKVGQFKKNIYENNLKIGFLSNISFDKGISLFFETIEKLTSEGFSVHAKIAGPFEDKKVEKYVLEKVNNSSAIKYIGPIYNQKKYEFFNDINVLLFPTQYKNEAEPLTIHECFSYGIPVISLDRGCISEIMRDFPIFCISEPLNYASESVKIIQNNFQTFDSLSKVSNEVRLSFKSQKFTAEESLENLIKEIITS